MSDYTLHAFYKFVDLPDNEELKPQILNLMKNWRIFGTIILAHEGLNGTICGLDADIQGFWQDFIAEPCWSDIRVNITHSTFQAFEKAKVKIRKEIVTMGIPEVKANEADDTHISGIAWNQLIDNPDTLIIDTRNDYEYELGTFKGAINPKTENFRDFPAYVQSELMAHMDKPIAMFCTGGVRCEKSTQYLKNLGFKEVYQLNGGILTYLQTTPPEQSRWVGDCFVFDDRVAVSQTELLG
jgi:UPF0176 protein